MYEHKPVLLAEAIDGLNIKEAGIYVDATLGGAGHSYHILSRLKTGHLYGFDQDEAAIETSRTHLQTLSLNNFTLLHANFKFIKEELEKLGVTKVDGIIFDLGVSSFQFDTPERGFSYRYDAKLDMRMDQSQGRSAYDIINTYSESDLAKVIYEYGEERFARNIAHQIVVARQERPVTTTFELVELIKAAIPARYQQGGGHPAKRTFQALRIETNNEIGNLQESLEKAISLLNTGGRICVISFHSLEDRIVKEVFNKYAKAEASNRFMPAEPTKILEYRLITKKPILPSSEEINVNRRSHSAKLRIIERL